MKLFKKLRKGFTLIELVVVIAVIAILSAVSVVTYVSITNKAKQSNDQQYIDQVNLSLAAVEVTAKPATMYDALQAAEADGFSVANFKAESKSYEFAYSMEDNRFVILEDNKITYPKNLTGAKTGFNLWKFTSSSNLVDGYSHYLLDSASGAVVTTGGVDVGSNKDITSISYSSNDSSRSSIIRAYGGTLNVGNNANDIAKGDVHFYGLIDASKIYTENKCFYTHGVIGKMELKAGKAIAKEGGVVYLTSATPDAGSTATVEIAENGGQFIIPENVTTDEVPAAVAEKVGYTVEGNDYSSSTKTQSSSYNIATLKELELFRDLVNGGFSFDGCTVKLTSDITLEGGWTPIGEGSRSVEKTKYEGNYAGADAEARLFAGEFDGNGKTISNLTNKGFTPKFTTLDGGKQTFCYGFFGILSRNANVHDIKFKNVDIDARSMVKNVNNVDSYGDSIGAAVGFIGEDETKRGTVRVENITVDGSIKADEACGGVVGRAYPKQTTVIINGNTNNAEVTCNGKAAGIVGTLSKYVSGKTVVELKNNTNTGKITCTGTYQAGNPYSGYNVATGIVTAMDGFNFNSTTMKSWATGNSNTGKLYIGSAEQANHCFYEPNIGAYDLTE